METVLVQAPAVEYGHNIEPSLTNDDDKWPADYSRKLVTAALQGHIQALDPASCPAGAEDSFFVADLGIVYRQHGRWRQALPRVDPFYAVKCNGDPRVLRLMAALGLGFDCASKTEIAYMLGLGISPDRIVYANPIKTPSYLRYAAQHQVDLMTFDSVDELRKCQQMAPRAQLLLRIATDDSAALCQLSDKFGAPVGQARALLEAARDLDLAVVGVAFHVGSGSSDPDAFRTSLRDARQIFDLARVLGMPPMTVLDIGGGFEDETFEATAEVVNRALDEFFPQGESAATSLRIIAEPGRFYVSHAFNLAAHVIGRRWVDEEAGKAMVFVNDGVYGNLNCIIYDHQAPIPKLMPGSNARATDRTYEYSIWGPTCDGLDCITKSCHLGALLDAGDWLLFTDVGAYTMCAATSFNGFNGKSQVVYVCSEPGLRDLVKV